MRRVPSSSPIGTDRSADIGRQPAILAESSDPRQIHIPRETWYQFSPVCSEAAGQLCVVDGAPALGAHREHLVLLALGPALDEAIPELHAEVAPRHRAAVAIERCRAHRRDRPLDADVTVGW